jgi:hypothetical protein
MPKPGEPDLAARVIHQDVRRVDILVNEAAFVQSAKRNRQREDEAQEPSNFHWRAD